MKISGKEYSAVKYIAIEGVIGAGKTTCADY